MRDIDIRCALREEMARMHNGEPDTLIVEELGLCQGVARVDLAVVNGTVHGYEIKSERDTLARLPSQTGVYNRTLEFVTVVAAKSHTASARLLIPQWWGIWEATKRSSKVELRIVRKARRNPRLDSYAIAQLLWRSEALQALSERGLSCGMLSKSRRQLWECLASSVTIAELGSIVREQLKRRGESWRVLVRPS